MSPTPARNAPCPCGSDRKFKFCHGAVAVRTAIAPTATPAPDAARRACGPCTACCEGWAEGEIRGHRMRPGTPCRFLQDGRPGGACTIYAERPQQPCRNFVCGWLAPGSPLPDAFRPDRCGVILVPARWRDRLAWVLLSAGRDPSPELLAFMQAQARATGSPFWWSERGERLGYGPAAFQQEMAERLARGQPLW